MGLGRFLSAFFISFTVWAARPADFDQVKWDALLEKAAQTGEPHESTNAVYLSLSRVVPADENVSHQADYFSLVGVGAPKGDFLRLRAEAVSEHWVLTPQGVWNIDQWIFVFELSGDLRLSLHRQIVRTKEGLIRMVDSVPESENSALAHWNLLLKDWTSGRP